MWYREGRPRHSVGDVSTSARERAVDKIVRLAAQPHDLVTFWRASTKVITSRVPNYGSPCWYTLDPASLLITSHFNDEMTQFPPEWLANEYYEDDVNKLVDVAVSDTGIGTLHGPRSSGTYCRRRSRSTVRPTFALRSRQTPKPHPSWYRPALGLEHATRRSDRLPSMLPVSWGAGWLT